MTLTRRALQLLFVAVWTFLAMHSAGAAEGAATPGARSHPMTDIALSREGADRQLAGNPAVRKWLQAAEDDAEIRKGLTDEELQPRLNRVGSEGCRHCEMTRNLTRLDSQTRMSYLRSGMPLLCRRNAPIGEATSIDLDAAYRVFYLGLRAEARGVPHTRLTAERTAALERTFGAKTLEVAAKMPGGVQKLIDLGQKDISDEDAACFVDAVVRATVAQIDEADRDDLVLYLLGGRARAERPKTAALPAPFKSSRDVLDADFTLSAMPPALRKQMTSLGGKMPFNQVETHSLLSIKAGERSDYIEMKSVCTVVKAPILQCFQEASTMDDIPYLGSFYLGDTFPWTKKQQDYVHGAKTMDPPQYSMLSEPAQRPVTVKPDARMTFSVSSWRGEATGAPKQEKVTCRTGGRYAASRILPTLTGMAIDMACTVTEGGAETSRYTLSYVEDMRISLIRSWVYPEVTYLSTYESIEVK